MKNKWFRLYKNAARGDSVQFLWLFGITSVLLVITWLLNKFFFHIPFAETLGMVFDPGHFMDFTSGWPFLLQVFVNLMGVVLVGGFLVSVLTNILSGWGESYNNGSARFRFRNHLLFLGSDKVMAATIAGVAARGENRKRKIVVLSEHDAETLRYELFAAIDTDTCKRIVVLQGDITSIEQLRSVYALDSAAIYIMGEDADDGHDAHVLECLAALKQLKQVSSAKASSSTALLDCYLLCNNFSTLRLLQLQTERQSDSGINLVVLNRFESLAQRVFVTRQPVSGDYSYPLLDRTPLMPDSDGFVHMVIIGMTQMSYAVATTVAHIAHYPNFIRDHNLRTRITFITDPMEQEADFFRGHFNSLFELSHWHQYELHNDKLKLVKENKSFPNGDFLNVEWEFISAGVETEAVRSWLSACVADTRQQITLAVVGDNGFDNLAAAMYLPEPVLSSKIPVLIYQPEGAAEVEWMRKNNGFSQFYPFGMSDNCYDDGFVTRLRWAKETNLTYAQEFDHITDKSADDLWKRLRLAAQLSNIYHANFALATLRRYPLDSITRAEMEHMRWNVEKLLVGYRALDTETRNDLEWGRVPDAAAKADELKAHFYHYNIAPFADLRQESIDKDSILIESLARKLNLS